jgi:hypothetical protein
LFGGATRARVESREPRDEFLIAAVGPLTSGLVAELFWIVDVFASDASDMVRDRSPDLAIFCKAWRVWARSCCCYSPRPCS